MGRTPGFLSKGTSLHATNADRTSGLTGVVQSHLATAPKALQRSTEADLWDRQKQRHWWASLFCQT